MEKEDKRKKLTSYDIKESWWKLHSLLKEQIEILF